MVSFLQRIQSGQPSSPVVSKSSPMIMRTSSTDLEDVGVRSSQAYLKERLYEEQWAWLVGRIKKDTSR